MNKSFYTEKYQYLLLLFIVTFICHIIYTFFTADVKLTLASIFIDIVLIGIFLLALVRFYYGFFMSLILLPMFFLLENLSVINTVYHSQALTTFSFYAIDPRIIGFSIASFFSFLVLVNKKVSFFTAPLSIILPVAICFFALSSIWSVGGQEKYVQTSFYLLLALLYFTTYFSITTKKSFYRLITFIISLSLPALLMSYLQLFGGALYEYSDMSLKRISGPFNSPNLLGSLLLVTSALSLILLFTPNAIKNTLHRKFLIIYTALTIPIFILTFSRSAWVGMLIFLTLFSLQKKRFVFTIILFFILSFSTLLMFEVTRERLTGFSQRTMFDSMYARENIWKLSHSKFIQRPLLGYGAGSFSEVINDTKESAKGTDNPHNDFVFFSIEGGLIGIIVFISIISAFYINLIKIHIQLKKTPLHVLSLGILSLFFSITVISLVESYYEGNFLHLFIWSMLAGWFSLANKVLSKPLPLAY